MAGVCFFTEDGALQRLSGNRENEMKLISKQEHCRLPGFTDSQVRGWIDPEIWIQTKSYEPLFHDLGRRQSLVAAS